MKNEIESAMAKAFFASAWAEQCEECGHGNILSGNEILDLIPDEIDPAAIHAAETLYMDMERVNNVSIEELFERAVYLHGGYADRNPTPENFGFYCAMQAMGHGVGLVDAFGAQARDSIQIPYVEFGGYSLEKDYFEE